MAQDNLYQPGDAVPLEATFKNAAGVATNPTSVALTIRSPDGTTVTPTPTNTGTGVYHYDYTLASNAPEGVWEYIFAGTGTVTAAERKTFVVEPVSLITRLDATALVTLADARAFVFRDVTDNRQDRELIERINEYSRAVYKYTGREWLPQTASATRTFRYNGSGFLSFAPCEARTITAVTMFADMPTANQVVLTVASTTVEGQWRPFPGDKTPEGTYYGLQLPTVGRGTTCVDGDPYVGSSGGFGSSSAYFRRSSNVTVTGDWGVAASLAGVPSDVQLAVKVAIKDAYVNPAGMSTGTFGSTSFTEEVVSDSAANDPYATNLPYEARALLHDYRREQGYVFA